MKSIVLVSSEALRATMAGIAIRYTEMSRALAAQDFSVTLCAPEIDTQSYPAPYGVEVCEFSSIESWHRYDLIVAQGHLVQPILDAAPSAMVVVDLYDPYFIEHASYIEHLGDQVFTNALNEWQRFIHQGDAFLCANQAQKLLYAGMLVSAGRVSAELISNDPALDSLIHVVPFGVHAGEQLQRTGDSDTFTILFGGLYDWYEPNVLLHALNTPALEQCQLVFVKSPNPEHTPQQQLLKVQQWCADNNWDSSRIKLVDWVPYQDRHTLLENADVMVATHSHSLETQLSTRTRFLDAIASGLPIITSDGGEVATLVARYGAGKVVEANCVTALRDAIIFAKNDLASITIDASRRLEFIDDFAWSKSVEPIVKLASKQFERDVAPNNTTPVQPLRTGRTHNQSLSKSFTVVLPTYNRMDIMPDVIAALENQYNPPQFDLVVINDGSSDSTKEWLDAHDFTIPTRVIHQPNGGPAKARNAGLDAATGDYIILLGDDTVPDRYWLSSHERAHQQRNFDPNIVVVGYIDWHRSMRITPFIDFVDETGWQFAFNKIEDINNLPYNYFYGSNLSLARSLIHNERFDTSFPYPAWEDSELGYRLKLKGCSYVYEHGIQTEHLHKTTIARFAQRQRKAGYCAMVFNRLHPEVGAMVWPSRESLESASGPIITTLRRWLAAALEILPFAFPQLWNKVLRDHYVMGIREYLSDHDLELTPALSQGDQHLLPLSYPGYSPLLQHQTGQLNHPYWQCEPDTHQAGHCVFGPNFRVVHNEPLLITFNLRTHNPSTRQTSEDLAAVTLDIYDNANDTVLIEQSLSATQLRECSEQNSDENALLIQATAGQCLEFRVFWHAKVALTIESIDVSRTN